MTKIVKLCDLRNGEEASVIEISTECRIRERLFDVGLIGSTRVKRLFDSPLGGMKAYRIRGATIAIRDEDCRYVTVEPEVNYGTD